MDLATVIGTAATLASVTSFAPQAWRIIHTRDIRAISAPTYALTVAGFMLWFIYGALLGQWPLMVTNAICCAMSAFILVMKLLPRHSRQAVAKAVDPEP
ncbi:hypothetical protein EOD42_16490 [Rhodovarius crocodyli]|uniref:Glutathione synthetase n=1 Tax=Rhodovarius crocodyli TaxID=1979269 RepID=A0A437MDY4_9PROT|nr:hypothetical protein EOD42_16490 [Rhodovarius crocodyli]